MHFFVRMSPRNASGLQSEVASLRSRKQACFVHPGERMKYVLRSTKDKLGIL